jgi:hypothetical protein
MEAPSEDDVVSGVEDAEEAKDIAAVIEALATCCNFPDDLETAAEAAADALERLAGDATAEYDRKAAANAVLSALKAYRTNPVRCFWNHPHVFDIFW